MVAPTDRPATGPVRGRRSVLGEEEERKTSGRGDDDDNDDDNDDGSGPEFITQFPYKSCQRSKSPRKMTGHR